MPRYTLCMAASAVVVWQVLFSGIAAAETFPWTMPQTLASKDGPLTWTVTRAEGLVTIEGKHPKWSVKHTCAPDGTPRTTEKVVGKRLTRLVWTQAGVEYTFDVNAKTETKKIADRSLWDGDTLDARLAGLDWAKKKRHDFKILDTDSDKAEVLPMKAELQGEESCGAGKCRHVVLRYDGFGAMFVAPWHYRYGTAADAPYVSFEHEKETFQLAAR
jgi:hypothetical protein